MKGNNPIWNQLNRDKKEQSNMEQSSGWKKRTEDMGIENRADTNLAQKRKTLATGGQGRGETRTGSRLARAGTGTVWT